ncbi:protein yellow [Drosophila guanche]|uniref:Blast:Protein yellow n=1 Tax=Drosophila guanche TaxID=7266 RepID=A0A3B0K4B1_DROGU|nr:protein yellow [Drosophila guanche]SPP89057.1 blast:Protein yellow [Drosophila guanche]
MIRYSTKYSWKITLQLTLLIKFVNSVSFVESLNEGYGHVIQPSFQERESQLKIINEWKYLDFEYPTFVERQQAIMNGDFIPKNNLPLGIDIDVNNNRLFITTPRWKDGVPASLGTIPFPTRELSPAIKPYPNFEAHGNPYNPDCSKLISVYRTTIDACNRLWLIDSGIVNATININQICPPKIVAFDLGTDQMIVRYDLPKSQVKEDSLHSNIIMEVGDRCEDAHAIVADVWRFGLVVYSLAKNKSWRVTNYNFSPNPVASDFKVYGLNFQWLDGVFGMSISYDLKSKQRVLYFHPMASFKEFIVSTDLLLTESLWENKSQDNAQYFFSIGDRGYNGQSSTSGIARNGVMFYTQVHRDNIGCWDTAKPYTRSNLGILLDPTVSSTLIQFPNDLKVDDGENQSVWIMSNRLPIYLYGQLDYSEINFRILKGDVNMMINNTICNPVNTYGNGTKSAIVLIEEGQCY